MPSHVVIGASRGIGYGFLQYLSSDPSNDVYGLVRDVVATQKKVTDNKLERVTLIQADMDDYKSLFKAAEQVAQSTGGSADYIWINGAYMSTKTAEKFFSDFSPDEYDTLLDDFQAHWRTNVIGVINSHNAFLPLVRKSSIKKIITISTAMSDMELARRYGIFEAATYSVTKAAVNAVVAKYDAKHRSEGILFLALCPGNVYTANPRECPPNTPTYIILLTRSSPSRSPQRAPKETDRVSTKLLEHSEDAF